MKNKKPNLEGQLRPPSVQTKRIERDVDEEVRIHLDMKTEEYIARGMGPAEARRRALADFGDVDETTEYCRQMSEGKVRKMRTRELFADITNDLRIALRRAWKAPLFSGIVILTLGLGIGATSSVFSVLNGVLLSEPPYPDAERLVRVWNEHDGAGLEDYFVAPVDVLNAQAEARTLEGYSAYIVGQATLVPDDGNPVQINSVTVTHELFRTLGVDPALGRFFEAEDSRNAGPGAGTVVLGYDYWQTAFGGDPTVVGTTLRFRGGLPTIVGITSADLDFADRPDVFFTFGDLVQNVSYRDRFLDGIARLRPGVGPEAASAELREIGLRTEPERWDGWEVSTATLQDALVGDVRPVLWILMASAALMLLIACANVANLLLSRASSRTTEMAVRSSLGSGRYRTLRMLMIESLVLAGAGCIAGLALTYVGLDSLLALVREQLPRVDAVSLDGRVLGFALVSTLITALAFGLAPAFQLLRVDLSAGLREGDRNSAGSASGDRLRGFLVGGQLTVSVVLLVGSLLLVRSFGNLLGADRGFQDEGIVTMEFSLWPPDYTGLEDAQRFYRELLEGVEAVPGVSSAGATSTVPFSVQRDYPSPFDIVGQPTQPEETQHIAYYRQVTPGFFEVMGTEILSGRALTDADNVDAAGVVVVNETFARRFWQGQDPVGKRLSDTARPFGPLGQTLREEVEVVGVMKDVYYGDLRTPTEAAIYFPVEQAPFRRLSLLVRTGDDAQRVVRDVRGVVRSMDGTLAPANVSTVDVLVSRAFARDRFVVFLLSLFGAGAISLAAIGVFGLLAYAVTQKDREFGIRMALGATPQSVVKIIVVRSLKLGGTGAAIGLLAALPLSRLLGSQLYGVNPNDPLVFGLVGVIMIVVVLVAAYAPAVRVLRVDPARALRA